MKKATITLITSAALAFAIPLYAGDSPGMKSDSKQKTGYSQQQSEKTGYSQQQTDQMQSSQNITADELEGMEVVSQQGEEIGEIKKITIDSQSGEVQFVTVSQGGILGMGAKEIAVPLSAFEIRDDQAVLTVDQSKFENVPQQNAEVTDSDYLRDLETHYGVGPAWNKGEDLDNTPENRLMNQDSTEPGEDDDLQN